MRNRAVENGSGLHPNFNDYQGYEQEKGRIVGLNRFNQKIISKSSSYQSLGIASLPSFQGDEDSSRQSSYSQKHKLKVKNLEMVPCDNEYYEDYGVPRP